MHAGSAIFSQLMDIVPWRRFETCVTRYQGDYKIKEFFCAEHFRVMAFAQLTYRESLRDIEVCLKAIGSRLYHMGIKKPVSRNNLSHANETRDWRIYADFAQILISQAKALYADDPLALDVVSTVYALDSTTIDLCMNLFPWARFRTTKSAIKVHTLMNLRGSIPEFIHITNGKVYDVKILDFLIPQPGAFYIMDHKKPTDPRQTTAACCILSRGLEPSIFAMTAHRAARCLTTSLCLVSLAYILRDLTIDAQPLLFYCLPTSKQVPISLSVIYPRPFSERHADCSHHEGNQADHGSRGPHWPLQQSHIRPRQRQPCQGQVQYR